MVDFFKDQTDQELIEIAASQMGQNRAPAAAMELQRRLVVAIQEFKKASETQAEAAKQQAEASRLQSGKMLWLTAAMAFLAVASLVMSGVVWVALRPRASAPLPTPAAQAAATPDDPSWLIKSFDGRLLVVQHGTAEYTATCAGGGSYRNTDSPKDPNYTQTFSTCSLPFGLIGKSVAPWGQGQPDSDGFFVNLGQVGDALLINRSKHDNHSRWEQDNFNIKSVTAK
jgi:hypothetical protein